MRQWWRDEFPGVPMWTAPVFLPFALVVRIGEGGFAAYLLAIAAIAFVILYAAGLV